MRRIALTAVLAPATQTLAVPADAGRAEMAPGTTSEFVDGGSALFTAALDGSALDALRGRNVVRSEV